MHTYMCRGGGMSMFLVRASTVRAAIRRRASGIRVCSGRRGLITAATASGAPRVVMSYTTNAGTGSGSHNAAAAATTTAVSNHLSDTRQMKSTKTLSSTSVAGHGPNYAAVTKPYGFGTFANLPFHPVLSHYFDSNTKRSQSTSSSYDIAIMGAPFDLGTTHRPGSRFGPAAIRQSSSHIDPHYHFSPYTHTNPLADDRQVVVDVGDASLTYLDKVTALEQLEQAHRTISCRGQDVNIGDRPQPLSSLSATPPARILALGGDHLTTLPALRAAHSVWGPLSIIHFDAHIDTWSPSVLGGDVSTLAGINHGTFLHQAHEESLLVPDSSIHLGIRGVLGDPVEDMANDERCGFETITARDIDRPGVQGILDSVRKRVGTNRVYVSVDIDVLDPAFAPGTGTPEPGGWSTRELLAILDGLKGIGGGVIGADVVEVAPIYDNQGAITLLAATEVALALLRLMVEEPVGR